MSEENAVIDAPAADDTTPSPADNPAPSTPETDKPLTAADAAFWREEAKKKGSAEASLRRRLREFEQAEEARKQSELSETQRLQQELDRIKAENSDLLTFKQTIAVRDSVTESARDPKVQARRPEALHKLVDASALTFKEDGSVDGIEKELARIKREFPELFYTSPGDANGAPAGNQGGAFDMNALIRRNAGYR